MLQTHSVNNDSDPFDMLHFEGFSFISNPVYRQLTLDQKGFWTYNISSDINDAVEILEYQVCKTFNR